MADRNNALRETVRRKYAEIARRGSPNPDGSCCGNGQKHQEEAFFIAGDAYEGVPGYLAAADLGLGCGVPVEHAGLQPGQTVLDLGSGAGLDAFIARREVGESGHVIGVDMTGEMIAKARANARQSGFSNVEFRLGEIEHLPVESTSIDVVISNCVLNLVPDKRQAFAEINRVLKPGGHFCISDIVASAALPGWLQGIADAYAGCVAGALPRRDYLDLVAAAGFERLRVVAEKTITVPGQLLDEQLSAKQRAEIERRKLALFSITLVADKH
jgi:ubiquinone/menaquinone biosynthesis C-methylase UbiE